MSTLLYNPDRKSKDDLISEFVVRTGIYDEIMKDLETSKMNHPEQHYLLVGQRGTGKTTLLHRIKYGVEDSKKLNSWLIPVAFSEEQYNISELADFWINVGQYLEDYLGFDGLYEKMDQLRNKSNFEEASLDLLENELKQRGNKIVLLIDNIGDLLKKIEEKEVRRLREVLQTREFIRLIAGSPFFLESILDYHQPLFEFFKVMRLEGLNQKETLRLLLKLGEIYGEKGKIEKIIEETPQRIEVLRTLTGGVPRTIALMFNIFIDYEHSDSVKDLEKILDAVTPLYKHRMDDLKKQQQKIVDTVARKWDPISVKEISEKTNLESKIISSQLRQLEKNQIIEKIKTDTKNHLYVLQERFWNIWYLMRYGRRHDKQRVIWFVRFLELWCDKKDIEDRMRFFINKLSNKEYEKHTDDFFAMVYSSLQGIDLMLKVSMIEKMPALIKPVLAIKEAEILNEAKMKIKNDNIEEAVYLLLHLKSISNEGKIHLRDMLFEGRDPLVQTKINQKIIDNIKIKIHGLDGGMQVPVIILEIVFLLCINNLVILAIYDTSDETMDLALNLFNFVGMTFSNLYDLKEDFSLEKAHISVLICMFIAVGKTNFLKKAFGKYLKQMNPAFENELTLIEYYISKKNSKVLNALNPTRKMVLEKLIKRVESFVSSPSFRPTGD